MACAGLCIGYQWFTLCFLSLGFSLAKQKRDRGMTDVTKAIARIDPPESRVRIAYTALPQELAQFARIFNQHIRSDLVQRMRRETISHAASP